MNQINVWDSGECGSCLTARRQVFTTGSKILKDYLEGGCCETTKNKAIANALKYTIQGFALLR